MKISCIIPTCDRNEFLVEAINSVLAQTYPPHEILVINNGKTPVDLPEDIKHKVKIFNTVLYAGVAQARNFGASMADGDYLAFLDDDDFWHTEYLENVLEALREDHACVINRLDKFVDNNIVAYKNCHEKLTFDHLFVHNPGVTGSNTVIKKDVFHQLGGYDVYLPPSEDKSLIIEALRNNIKIKTLPDNQAIIRMHSGVRLSDAGKMAQGISHFVKKYSPLMTTRQRLNNWLKIHKYRHQAGNQFSFIPFLFIYIIFRFIKINDKVVNKFKSNS